MSLHVLLNLLILIGTSVVLLAVLKIVDIVVKPLRKQLNNSNEPLDLGSGIQLSPLDAIGTKATGGSINDCIAPLATSCEAAEGMVDSASESLLPAIESGAEAVSGMLEGLSL